MISFATILKKYKGRDRPHLHTNTVNFQYSCSVNVTNAEPGHRQKRDLSEFARSNVRPKRKIAQYVPRESLKNVYGNLP